MEVIYLNLIKVIYDKPTGNVRWKAQSFSFNIRNETVMFTHTVFIQHGMDSRSQSI